MNNKAIHIAIDGPVAAGKSTVAKKLASKLHFSYIDTGAMYRAVTLFALTNDIPIDSEERVFEAMKSISIQVRPPEKGENHGRLSTVLLNGTDVSWEIRASHVDEAVPTVASYPSVRNALVHLQRDAAEGQSVVMEGRDITHKVLPEAHIKIYLTANEEVRARRHFNELIKAGEQPNFDEVLKELLHRDSQDMNRKTDPLKIVPGVWIIDCGALSADQVVDLIAEKVHQLQNS
ncbi:(d)CMP kinase [Candidatus Woesebacteria bacterium]|nr:(d)CMP kinase [Candidatus Woesebacteria bacterium]